MKKIIKILTVLTLVLTSILISSSYAAALDTIDVTVTKTKVEPGSQVTVNIQFGKQLGAYTFDVAYDSNLFEYVSSEGGTHSDNQTRIRLTYYDSTGGSNPRENASVTFKAKEGIVTSNPTDFAITAEGLANPDASEQYDDITTPIKKDVLVEPNYVDYTLKLEYTGAIEENVNKEMELITESSMGKNYDHVRLTAEVTAKPTQTAVVKLLTTDSASVEHDLIQNGWGDAAGYEIGGKDVRQNLKLTGNFSEAGNYTIKITMIDRDNSDAVIASKDFNISVQSKSENQGPTNTTTPNNTTNQGQTNVNQNTEQLPTELPKTGMTKYGFVISTTLLLIAGYIYISKKKTEKVK